MTSTMKFSLQISLWKDLYKLDHNTLPESITLPSLTNDQKFVCDKDLTNKDAWNTKQYISHQRWFNKITLWNILGWIKRLL